MVCKYHHAMSTLMKANSSINNKTLSTTDAEIRMEEDYRALIFGVLSHDLRCWLFPFSVSFLDGLILKSDEVRLVGVAKIVGGNESRS
jgi:hypothetical protein